MSDRALLGRFLSSYLCYTKESSLAGRKADPQRVHMGCDLFLAIE